MAHPITSEPTSMVIARDFLSYDIVKLFIVLYPFVIFLYATLLDTLEFLINVIGILIVSHTEFEPPLATNIMIFEPRGILEIS